MELIFLNKKTLEVVDNAIVSTTFEITMDIVVSQKSYFIVNKSEVEAELGDVVILRSDEINYIGLLESLEQVDDYSLKVYTIDFTNLFDFDILAVSYEGDIIQYLTNIIYENLILNDDELQNINYFEVDSNYSVEGVLSYDDDTLINVQDLIETLSKTYSFRVQYNYELSGGKFSKIIMKLIGTQRGIVLTSNISAISDLSISDSVSQSTNKMVLLPKVDNEYTEKYIYYLLTDGSITENKDDPLRFDNVICKTILYADNEYETLDTKVSTELFLNNLEHNISFSLIVNNQLVKPFHDIYLGDFVEFRTSNKVYDSMITQISYKSTFSSCYITLGDYRIKLTEKIKLLEKNRSV